MRTRIIARSPRTGSRGAVRREPHQERLTLELVHTPSSVIVRGEVASAFEVVGIDAVASGDGETLSFSHEPSSTFEFDLDLGRMQSGLGASSGSYDFHLVLRRADGSTARWRLGRFATTLRDEAVDPIPLNGTLAWLHITGQGNVSLHFGDEMLRRTRVTTHRLSTGGSRLKFAMTVESFNRPVDAFVGTFVARESRRRTEFEVQVTELVDARRQQWGLYSYEVTGECKPSALIADGDDPSSIYDPHVELHLRDVAKPVRGPITRGRRLGTRVGDIAVKHPTSRQLLVPHFTFRGKRLAFSSERFTPSNYRFMRRLRWVSWMFTVVRPFTGIWIVGEVPYKAQDNGLHFFRWMREHHPGRRVYYVIDPRSPDIERVLPLGNVIEHRSRRHILLSQLAARFVGSHDAEYLYASRSAGMVRRSKGLRVFLQHGVTATKNVSAKYGRRQMVERPPDVFCVNSPLEREIVIQDLEYLPSQVPITGFTRFDELFADDVEEQPRIVVMPTWRDWLSTEALFLDSEFLQRWQAFLSHPGLAQLAREYGLSIEFVVHPNMRHHAELFDLPGITLSPPGHDLQALLKSSSALVTDYSSVAWDMSFLDRPVFYFHFDVDRLNGNRMPFIDFATQLPGDVAADENALVEALQMRWHDHEVHLPPEFRHRSRAFLSHRDRKNNQRTYDVVRRADGVKARGTRIRNARWLRNADRWFRSSRLYTPAMKAVYTVATLIPHRELVVFENGHGQEFSAGPRDVYERLIASGDVPAITYINDTAVRLPDLATRKVRSFSPRHYWDLGRANQWVVDDEPVTAVRPPRRTLVVQAGLDRGSES